MVLGNVNKTLIESVRSAQAARDKAIVDILHTNSSEVYSNEFKAREAGRIISELRITKESLKVRGSDAIAAKVTEIDDEEKAAAALRSVDLDYLNRLTVKLDASEKLLHKSVGADGKVYMDNLTEALKNQLRTYFSEFHDDPLAIALILDRMGQYGAAVIPDDNTGKRQAHLNAVRTVFNTIMDRCCNIAGDRGVSSVQDVHLFTREEEEALCGYLRRQNNDFSLDDAELIDQISEKSQGSSAGLKSILWRLQIATERELRAAI